MIRKSIQFLLFTGAVLLMALPALQNHYKFITINNGYLFGKTNEAVKPPFIVDSFLTEYYQQKVNAYLDVNTGFRPWFIRLDNQLNYSLFKDGSNGVVIGKDNHLFFDYYIAAYT